MRLHPYAALFPEMEPDQLQELADDIKANGQRQKIVTLKENGVDKILDGRNREKACRMAGVEPVYKEFTGKDPLGYVISQNMRRRHLSVKVRSEIAAKLVTMRHGGDRKIKAPNGALTQEAAAKRVGVSRRSVQRAAKKLKPKAAAKPKKTEAGWTKEELAKDQELADCLLMIESIYGAEDTKAIRNGTIPLKRADVLFLGKMPKENMQKIQDLIFTTGWSPKKCVEFINTEPDDDSTVWDLKHLCLTTKGKYWTGDFEGYSITVKYNRAAKRS
jgi:hypothetical protein